MDEIPQTLLEAIRYFSDADICNEWMRDIKWPDGKITCPKCGGDSVSPVKGRPTLQCNSRACKAQTSYKVGTIFEDSPLSLDKWFVAMWSIANCRNGISSHELARALGIRQKSAWFMLHRIRCAMHIGTDHKWDGEVESDETYIGGLAKNMHAKRRAKKITGRGGADKTPVQAMVRRDPEGSEVRTFVVPATDAEAIVGNIMRNVDRETAVYTDGETAATGLAAAFRHETVNHSAWEFVRGRVHTNSVENFFTLLKRAIKGTYVAVSPWHLFRYAHEQGYRFNVKDLSDAARFIRLLRGVVGKRLTYKELAAIGDAGFMGIK